MAIAGSITKAKKWYLESERARIGFGLLGCCIAFAFLNALYNFRFPTQTFESWSFLTSAIASIPNAPRIGLLLIIGLGTAYFGRSPSAPLATGTKVVLWATVGICAYSYSLYAYNWWAGQFHLLDRIIVLGLGIATIRWPNLVGLFAFSVLVSAQQWAVVLSVDNELTNRALFLDLLVCFQVVVLLRSFLRIPDFLTFAVPTGLLCIHYAWAGLSKVLVSPRGWEWLVDNSLGNLAINGTLSGWTALWDVASSTVVANYIDGLGFVALLFAIGIELFAPLSLLSKRLFILSALARVGLHLGIFLTTGDLFWNWVVFGLLLIVAAWKTTEEERRAFSWRAVGIILLLVVCLTPFTRARNLGWFDTAMVGEFDLIVIGESGQHYVVYDAWAEPFDLAMVHGAFTDLVNGPTLTASFGTTRNYDDFVALEAMRSPEEALTYIAEHGRNRYSERSARRFDLFVRRMLSADNLERRQSTLASFLSFVQPPHHIWNYPNGEPLWDSQERPVRAELYYSLFWHDSDIHLLTRHLARTVHL
ncbi:MAG: hypothetical protein KC561_05145 [Myxococcales bacterium]|nr:hypothetical protein [Myxococcales bacterium]